MAALVQTYPQQSGTVTMLQTRNGSGTGSAMLPAQVPPQQYGAAQQQRNTYHGAPGAGASPMAYRGTSTPIQPYTYTATPNLNPNGQWQQSGAFRASSSSAVPTMQTFGHNANGFTGSRHSANSSMSNLPNPTMGVAARGSRDDSALPAPGSRRVSPNPRPQSAYFSNSSIQLAPAQAAPAKSSPDRYRRPAPSTSAQQAYPQGLATPSGSGMAAVNHLYNPRPSPDAGRRPSPSQTSRPNSFYATVPGSVDDMQLHRHPDEGKRVRRRSMPTLDSAEFIKPLTPHTSKRPDEVSRTEPTKAAADKEQIKTARIVSMNNAAKTGSSESLVSSRSSNSRPSSSANRNNVSTPTGNPAQLSSVPDENALNQDYPKLVTIPPRSSSSDAAKRVANPSPLSKPVTMDTGAGSSGPAATKSAAAATPTPAEPVSTPSSNYTSPAVKQLAAINQKGGKLKSKTSRLRRAFSFGSAAELQNAGLTNGTSKNEETTPTVAATTAKLQKSQPPEEFDDAEQARIAEQQEAAGIGHNIYAGSRLFSGSNDNLSISSTASSASIMIRKMGRGMKKGGRNLVGLFRPKSIIGVPTTDSQTPEGSQATVSMVTAEAERSEGELVNVNADPHSQSGGGTGYPRLERNSIDASTAAANMIPERAGSSGTDNSNTRKSIVGGDRERAEVLAAVRKGILKHTNGATSPAPRIESKSPAFELPAVPRVSESPISSAPSTPSDDNQTHKRNGSSVTIGNEDYFMTALRIRQDTQSAPSTPQGGGKRNATFSPRIVFYDTWPSQEYDRRGEIATCNRLTPMLAQQIKEELNSFKMEMEVHENSKIYTHFF